ncbi:hypothetical protein C7Y72_01815 [Paraconexibacter algicola]|uniref:Uncharacterized protein n=1 Tax=Paraconexibacter algicola TaxID=2133960 RepID=A0A2T4UGY3_9ACTN|nr:hypothetical protein C7Y72_01815 [Paraconexibacter algicola]
MARAVPARQHRGGGRARPARRVARRWHPRVRARRRRGPAVRRRRRRRLRPGPAPHPHRRAGDRAARRGRRAGRRAARLGTLPRRLRGVRRRRAGRAAGLSVTGEQDALEAGRGRAALDVLVQLVGRFGNLALGVVATVVLVQALGIEGNGQWATILAVATLVGVAGEFGLEPSAVRLAAQEREDEARWITALLLVRCAIALPASLLAAAICFAVSTDGTMALAGALVSGTILAGAPMSLRTIFQLRVRNDVPIVVMTVNSVAWLAAIVLLAVLDGGLVAFAASFLAIQVATTGLMVVLALRELDLQGGELVARARRLVRIGFVVGIGTALTTAYAKVDQVMVLEIAGERDAGLYGSAYILLDRLQFIPSAVMTTAFPLLAAAWPGDRPRIHGLAQRILELLLLASAPILAFTVVAPEQVVRALFGAEFQDAGAALPILMGAYVLVAFGYLMGFMAIVVDAQRIFVRIALAGLLFNVVANLLVIPDHGYVGAAWTTLATEVLVCGLAARATLVGRVGMRPALVPLLRIAAAAAVMGVAVAAAERAGAPLAVLVLTAALSYPAAVLALRAVPRSDVTRAVGAVRGRLGG